MLFAGGWLAVAPQLVFATATTPFISEIYPAPNANEPEWVEVTNPTDQVASISGWLLYDQLSSPSLLLTINLSELLPNEAVAFELPTAKLNNTGDAVVLQNADGGEVDRFTFSSSSVGKSWQKNSQLSDAYLATPTKNIAPTFLETTPTALPVTQTPSPTNSLFLEPSLTPTPTSEKPLIQISEVMACPEDGEQEWVELYNAGEQIVWLNNWVLQDAQANRVTLSHSLLPNTYQIVDWSKALLNNQGDVVTLFDENGNNVVSLVLPQCSAGQSYALVGTTHVMTNQPTPDEPNISGLPTPTNIQQLSTTSSVSATLQRTSQITAFIPKIVPFTLESDGSYQLAAPATIQILKTSSVEPIPMAGAIMSLSSLLLAAFFLNVSKS